jgi:hypothetical protein
MSLKFEHSTVHLLHFVKGRSQLNRQESPFDHFMKGKIQLY